MFCSFTRPIAPAIITIVGITFFFQKSGLIKHDQLEFYAGQSWALAKLFFQEWIVLNLYLFTMVQCCLKGLKHEIFDLWFFHESIVPGPWIHMLKYFENIFVFAEILKSFVLLSV